MQEIEFLEPNKIFYKLFYRQIFIYSIVSSIVLIFSLFFYTKALILTNIFGLVSIIIYDLLLYLTEIKFSNLSFVSGFIKSFVRIILLGAIIFLFIYYMSINSINGSTITFEDTYKTLNLYLFIFYISIPAISSFWQLITLKKVESK